VMNSSGAVEEMPVTNLVDISNNTSKRRLYSEVAALEVLKQTVQTQFRPSIDERV